MADLSEYTIVRDSLHTERMFYLYHRLGLWSNVVVGAKYAHADGQRLTKTRVLEALKAVVEAQPQLRTTGVPVPSDQEGRTELRIGLLRAIDIEACVEFVESSSDGEITASLIERVHNGWSFLEPDQPHFKVLVIDLRSMVFVLHHLVGDGVSGNIFHKAFLKALNSQARYESRGEPEGSSRWIVRSDPATTQLPVSFLDIWRQGHTLGKPWGPSMLELLWLALYAIAHQWLFGARYFFDEFPAPNFPFPTNPTAVAGEAQRTLTRNIVSRIPAATMKKVLEVCRSEGVTFTALLNTVVMATLAEDVYPKTTYGSSRTPLDVRTRLPESLATVDAGLISNRSSGLPSPIFRVRKFREAAKSTAPGVTGYSEDAGTSRRLLMKLAREETARIKSNIDAGVRMLITYESQGAPEDLDHMLQKVLPNVGLGLRRTFLISNIGATDFNVDNSGPWSIGNLVFSAAATSAHVGTRGFIFHVAGVKGGDTTIVTGWEEGVASEDLARKTIEGTLARIEAMVS